MAQTKILFLINSLSLGGAERVLSILLEAFVKDPQYLVTLVLLEDEVAYPLPENIDIAVLSQMSDRDSGVKKTLAIPLFVQRFYRVVKEKKPDLILSFLFRADFVNMLTSFLHDRPALISARVNTSSTYADGSLQAKINRLLVRRLYPRARKIVSVSEGTAADLVENFGVCAKKSVVIYNPYRVEKIRQLSQETIMPQPQREKTVVALSRFRPVKNLEMLIRAFAGLPDDVKLLLIGDGEEAEKLQNLVATLGLSERVMFTGSQGNPYPYLAASSIYVSASRSEGFPNAMVEAMICGCAVVSTDCPSGPREILAPSTDPLSLLRRGREDAEYGILVAVDDIDAMREALLSLLENDQLRRSYSEKALQRAGDFSYDRVIEAYRKLFSDVVSECSA